MGAEQDISLGVSPIPVAIFSVGVVGAVDGGPKAAAAVDLQHTTTAVDLAHAVRDWPKAIHLQHATTAVDLAYAELDSADAADSG